MVLGDDASWLLFPDPEGKLKCFENVKSALLVIVLDVSVL
jgi:hypothetical protein